MSESFSLEVRNLSMQYSRGRPAALDRVSLTVPKGSFVALVGPNGAGKSTLIRCCLGFERPTSGSVRILGIDPLVDRPAALSQVGYVGQSTGLYRDLTPDDHLALASSLRRGFDRVRAARSLDEQGISKTVAVRHLSGGQQAALAIALALGTRAPILLLDEPLASLDPLARRDVLSIVAAAVREEGTTVVLASHIVNDLEGTCDRLIVLAPATVALDENVAVARRHHVVVPLAESDGADIIGVFRDHAGAQWALVRQVAPQAVPASVEDIVLGYLAAGRNLGQSALAS